MCDQMCAACIHWTQIIKRCGQWEVGDGRCRLWWCDVCSELDPTVQFTDHHKYTHTHTHIHAQSKQMSPRERGREKGEGRRVMCVCLPHELFASPTVNEHTTRVTRILPPMQCSAAQHRAVERGTISTAFTAHKSKYQPHAYPELMNSERICTAFGFDSL